MLLSLRDNGDNIKHSGTKQKRHALSCDCRSVLVGSLSRESERSRGKKERKIWQMPEFRQDKDRAMVCWSMTAPLREMGTEEKNEGNK